MGNNTSTQYMIHTMPRRRWYVQDFLIPSMLEQGIPLENITVYEDNGQGSLKATMDSWLTLPEEGGTWHLQDDILLARDFKQKTEEYDAGIVCTFNSRYDKGRPSGEVSVKEMWYSFPCLRIPNKITHECADWVLNGIIGNPVYKDWWQGKQNSDLLFKKFLADTYPNETALNLDPNIVEHIDWLMGGTTLKSAREEIVRSLSWQDNTLVEKLKAKLKATGHLDIRVK